MVTFVASKKCIRYVLLQASFSLCLVTFSIFIFFMNTMEIKGIHTYVTFYILYYMHVMYDSYYIRHYHFICIFPSAVRKAKKIYCVSLTLQHSFFIVCRCIKFISMHHYFLASIPYYPRIQK